MSIAKQKSAAPRQEKPFWGFSESGSLFRSATRVENAVTAFVRESCSEILEQFLSPADVEMALRIRPEYVRSAFPNAYLWSKIDHHAGWFSAPASTSAEETLKRCMPQCHDDPNAFRDWVERGERHTRRPCRFDGVQEHAVSVFGQTVEPPTLVSPCRVHS